MVIKTPLYCFYFIISALRTPICRARKGGLKDQAPEDLLAAVLKAIVEKTGLDPKMIQDVVVGNVLQPGAGATTARMAALYAGIPESASVMAVNRQCSSGLQAVATVVSAIKNGFYEIGIGAGVESMSKNYGPQALTVDVSEKILSFGPAADCLLPMGITSENVAEEFGISRDKQDYFSLASHQKAGAAQRKGLFEEEIIPITINKEDGTMATVTADDGIRADISMEGIRRLKPAFKDTGSTTAGNASQVSDGAAAVLLMKRSTAERLKLPILGKFVSFAVAGVPPRIMGIGPAIAIPQAIKKAGLKQDDIDIFELNEAFASQAVYCVEKLKLDITKVNPKGGAIALGHPLGCTGARQIATLLPELHRQGKRLGVVSMCIGTGMGAAAVIENEML